MIGCSRRRGSAPRRERQDAKKDTTDENNKEFERRTGHGDGQAKSRTDLSGVVLSPLLKGGPLVTDQRGGFELENLTQEELGAIFLWIGEEVLRCSHFDDVTVSHEDNTIGNGAGETHLVGDNDHGHTTFG